MTRVYEPMDMTTARWMQQPIVEVPLRDLEFSHDVHLGWVIDKLRGRDDNHANADLPLVVLHDGTYWVEDGHHRIAAAILRGYTDHITVRLYDKDAE